MFALVLQIPNENRTGFSIVHLYKRPRTENTACAKRVRPFAKIRTGESKSKLACILPGGRIFDEVKGTNNSGKAAETGPPEAFFQPNVIFSARKCAKIKNMSIFAVPKQRFWVGRTGQVLLPRPKRRGAGVVDRAALEMRCTGNCTGGSNPSLSAERAGQKWSAKGQKATNQLFVAFFIARKSCFQDFKSTVKDKVSLLNRYLFPAGQKR